MKAFLLAGVAVIGVAATAQTTMPATQATTAAVAVPNNILLADWKGPYQGVPPWDQVKPEQV